MIEVLADSGTLAMRVVYTARGLNWVFDWVPTEEAAEFSKRQAVDFAQHGDDGFTWYDAATCVRLINRALELTTKGK